MRDIKFRAWVKDHETSVWKMIHWFKEFFSDMSEVTGWYSDFPDSNDENVKLMQYTGLKDKKGVEIYEGDVVRVWENDDGYFEVIFKNDYVGGWVLKHPEHHEWVSLGARSMKHVEVIGNIYENPELLN